MERSLCSNRRVPIGAEEYSLGILCAAAVNLGDAVGGPRLDGSSVHEWDETALFRNTLPGVFPVMIPS